MEAIQLREDETSRFNIRLSDGQLAALRRARIEASPVSSSANEWEFRPSSVIGMVSCDGLTVVIRPRIPMDRVMFLVGYSLNPGDWRPSPFGLTQDDDLLEAVVPTFVLRTREAIRRGLLQGYRTEEDSLSTIRGRVRLNDQINVRFGQALPVEVVYDDYTEDIEENRLLKTAIHALWRMPIRSAEARRELGALRPAFTAVALGAYHQSAVPKVHYNRLNRRYKPAVELARLIIGDSILELSEGEMAGATFLMDMNLVFEIFLRSALREALRLSDYEWPGEISSRRDLALDEAGRIQLQPGISWWEGRRCVFVGDARYKCLDSQGSDIHRMLAYCTAANLPSGMLMYPSGEREPVVHRIAHAGIAIEVMPLNVNAQPQAVLAQVDRIAERVKAHRYKALTASGYSTR